MTLALPLARFAPSMRRCIWPDGCPVNIPSDRDLCYFHERSLDWRRVAPRPTDRFGHVLSHLREQDRPLLEYLIAPLTLQEVADKMGPGWTRRNVELAWKHVRADMGFVSGVHSATQAIDRLGLLRVVVGMDRCFCGR